MGHGKMKPGQNTKRAALFNPVVSSLFAQGLNGTAKRLQELAVWDNLEGEEGNLSIGSAQNFQKFIKEFTILGEPLLGIFPQDTLSAGWCISTNQHLLIEFFDDDQVSFAIIMPSEDSPDGKFRLNGRGTRASALKCLSMNHISGWVG